MDKKGAELGTEGGGEKWEVAGEGKGRCIVSVRVFLRPWNMEESYQKERELDTLQRGLCRMYVASKK